MEQQAVDIDTKASKAESRCKLLVLDRHHVQIGRSTGIWRLWS